MKTVNDGFIVLGHGDPMELVPRDDSPYDKEWGVPKKGILMFGELASVFTTRREAIAALKRTESFTERHRLGWANNLSVLPIKAVK